MCHSEVTTGKYCIFLSSWAQIYPAQLNEDPESGTQMDSSAHKWASEWQFSVIKNPSDSWDFYLK